MKVFLEQLINKAILQEFGEEYASLKFEVSFPPKPEMGDYSTNAALILAKLVGKSPKEVAEALESRIKNLGAGNAIADVKVLGGFLNFYVHSSHWFAKVLTEIATQKTEYGKAKSDNPEKIMVEYLSPNTNKPLHLGHLRNGVIGTAVVNVLKAQGHHVTKVGIINDRGVHICKAMLAYQRWGEGATPESSGQKPDHFVGSWYVRFAREAVENPALEQEAQEMLQKWEAGDPEIKKLWETIRDWVLTGWKETEQILGFKYDKPYFESDVYLGGKEIVEQGLQKGIFRKNEKGNVVFDLSEEEFGTDESGSPRMITLLRPDGTTLYTTQDLGLAVQRAQEFDLDRLVFVVGSEQRFHFQSLFAMLRALGFDWASRLYHLWYGMVYLPDGKMKSREGTVVDTDDLIEQMVQLAEEEIEQRTENNENDNKDEIVQRARQVALAAIKFYMLRQKATTDIHFDPKESLAFEGFTGPYVQYTYARAQSILRQVSSEQLVVSSIDCSVLGNQDERALVRLLEGYPEAVSVSARSYDPAHLATFIFKTAQAFNQFYSSSPVLKADQAVKDARLALAQATAQVIKNGLEILGIEAPEKM